MRGRPDRGHVVGQGSIAANEKGGHEVYRGSKAALNQDAQLRRPSRGDGVDGAGWIRTVPGGPEAPLTIGEAIPQLVDTLVVQRSTPGLRFIDRHGATMP